MKKRQRRGKVNIMKYDHKKIEARWQKFWAKHPELCAADDKSAKPKQYILDMFPYPSGDGLHAGHVESYTATDIICRYLRMNGKNVLHPQGWDAFGLPAENFAIKTKIHPAETTKKAIATFKKQMNMMGFSYDWSREVNSSSPEYYKWTQWFFLLLYKNGLAYKSKGKVNWCDSCQTVLANEQAEGGVCERCGKPVVQKDLEQWYFKITDFVESNGKTSGLLDGLDKIDWPESTKAGQRNWINKSEGAQFKMPIEGSDLAVEVFTTRLDTVFGMTFALIAPEHELVQKLKPQISNWSEVEKYINETKKKSELQRMAEVKDKTGVEIKGVKVINPFTKQEIPLFASDFVLAQYGTGAVMAVPGHDQRDFDFAKKFKLPIDEVIKPLTLPQPSPSKGEGAKGVELSEAYTEDGVLMNSGEFNGLTSAEARKKMVKWLEKEKIGQETINYKLRDWLVSRQRYWGAPIPIIYCDKCKNKKYKYLLLHGRQGSAKGAFFPWLEEQLISQGHTVSVFDLPNADKPHVVEQMDFISKNTEIDETTIILGHSFGGLVAMKLAEKHKIAKLILVDSFIKPEFTDQKRPDVERGFNWKLDFEKIKKNAGNISILADNRFPVIPEWQAYEMRKLFNAKAIFVQTEAEHFDAKIEPEILKVATDNGIFTDEDLPVELPDDVDFVPHGESPLMKSKKFHKVECPVCGGDARREADTMDTFVCSSWYYLRYSDPKNKKAFASKEMIKKWLPVDLYVGGAEHTVLHLLYTRFFTKVLHKLGFIDFDEPFLKLRHQGIILAPDGSKMSKSKGNVVNPDDVVKEYGADALRMFEMFMGQLEDAKPWNTKGIIGISRFLERVWNLYQKMELIDCGGECKEVPEGMPQMLHKTIKKVTEDIEGLRFNTAISQMMIFINFVTQFNVMPRGAAEAFLILLAPFAPHMAEELWAGLGHEESIFKSEWPKYNEAMVKDETIQMPVQINGKLRAILTVPADISEDEAKKFAISDITIIKWLDGKEPKKVIFVKGRLVNIVV